jgi:hypothetical protein
VSLRDAVRVLMHLDSSANALVLALVRNQPSSLHTVISHVIEVASTVEMHAEKAKNVLLRLCGKIQEKRNDTLEVIRLITSSFRDGTCVECSLYPQPSSGGPSADALSPLHPLRKVLSRRVGVL